MARAEEPELAGHRQEQEAYARLGHRYEPSVAGPSAVQPEPADAPGSSRQRSIRQQRRLQDRPRAREGSQVAVAPFRTAAEPSRPLLFQIGVELFQAVLFQAVLFQAVLFQAVLFQAVLFQDGAEPAPALTYHPSPLSPHRSGAVAYAGVEGAGGATEVSSDRSAFLPNPSRANSDCLGCGGGGGSQTGTAL